MKKTFKPAHEEPGRMWLDYILLPYGPFYQKSKEILGAKNGDTLILFNGPEVTIDKVMVIDNPRMCDFLSRMRYGVAWMVAFKKWLTYARMEGNGADVLDKDKCILVSYEPQDKV